jgi:predicted nuclease of restriction endonuclease-like (RecB) superfamily
MPQLSWTHFYQLVDIENDQKRSFYENQAIIHSWSVRELRRQIKAQLYENTPKKDIQAVFQTKLPAISPQEVFKNTYDFDFIEFHTGPDEKDLYRQIQGQAAERS